MSASRNASSGWSTASLGDAADTSPEEVLALGEHLDTCQAPDNGMVTLHRAAQAANRFVAAHPVTVALTVAATLGSIAVLQR